MQDAARDVESRSGLRLACPPFWICGNALGVFLESVVVASSRPFCSSVAAGYLPARFQKLALAEKCRTTRCAYPLLYKLVEHLAQIFQELHFAIA